MSIYFQPPPLTKHGGGLFSPTSLSQLNLSRVVFSLSWFHDNNNNHKRRHHLLLWIRLQVVELGTTGNEGLPGIDMNAPELAYFGQTRPRYPRVWDEIFERPEFTREEFSIMVNGECLDDMIPYSVKNQYYNLYAVHGGVPIHSNFHPGVPLEIAASVMTDIYKDGRKCFRITT